MDISVKKKNVKARSLLAQNIQEIWDTTKTPNQSVIGTEEGEESQVKSTENTFNKIIKENFLNIKKEMPIKV